LTFRETKTIWPGVRPAKFNSATAADRCFHGLRYETAGQFGQERLVRDAAPIVIVIQACGN
jgi:hypothetical protein